jgi:hypothetical protein
MGLSGSFLRKEVGSSSPHPSPAGRHPQTRWRSPSDTTMEQTCSVQEVSLTEMLLAPARKGALLANDTVPGAHSKRGSCRQGADGTGRTSLGPGVPCDSSPALGPHPLFSVSPELVYKAPDCASLPPLAHCVPKVLDLLPRSAGAERRWGGAWQACVRQTGWRPVQVESWWHVMSRTLLAVSMDSSETPPTWELWEHIFGGWGKEFPFLYHREGWSPRESVLDSRGLLQPRQCLPSDSTIPGHAGHLS